MTVSEDKVTVVTPTIDEEEAMGARKQTKIAIVMPTLNEEKAIDIVMDGIEKVMQSYNYHIIVVDGYSTDRTREIAEGRGATVIYQKGQGYGDALQTGFKCAYEELNADITVMMDADGTYDPKVIPELIQLVIEDKADLVIGNRFSKMDKGAMTLLNKTGNKILSWVARRVLRVKVHDTQCGFRVFRAQLIQAIDAKASGMPFAIEMLAEAIQLGAKITEVPIHYHKRIGKTKLSPINDGIGIFGLILRLTRDYRPLLFFVGLGGIFILAGTVLGMTVAIEWFATGTLTRLASVTLSALLIMTGIQLASLGLIADMIKDIKKS